MTKNIEKLKISNTGRKISIETRNKMSKSHVGKKQSIETIEKRTMKNVGKKRTLETKKKMSEAAKRRPPRGAEFKQKMRDSWIKRRLKNAA